MFVGTLVLYLEVFFEDYYRNYIKKCNQQNIKTILNKEEFRMVFEHVEESVINEEERNN